MPGKLLLNFYFLFAFIVITVVGLIVLPLILLVQIVFFKRTVASGLRRAIRFYGWVLVCIIPFISPVMVEYKNKKLPPAAIFVANHNSAIDPYLFGAINVENSFVTSWPFKIPVYGIFMRFAGYVNSEWGWDIVHEKCRQLLDGGSSVTIWPEGHRSRNGQLGRFKNGAFTLAVETGYPVVPVCILGSGAVLPPGKKMLKGGAVKLIVLSPQFPTNGRDRESSVRELRNRVNVLMAETLETNGHFRQLIPSHNKFGLND